MSKPRAILHVTIRGRVQGVGYRAWVEYQAAASHLEGWVRNRRDGTVEALFAGPQELVEEMLEACREGPPGARVTAVDRQEGLPEHMALGRAGEFLVLPTA